MFVVTPIVLIAFRMPFGCFANLFLIAFGSAADPEACAAEFDPNNAFLRLSGGAFAFMGITAPGGTFGITYDGHLGTLLSGSSYPAGVAFLRYGSSDFHFAKDELQHVVVVG